MININHENDTEPFRRIFRQFCKEWEREYDIETGEFSGTTEEFTFLLEEFKKGFNK